MVSCRPPALSSLPLALYGSHIPTTSVVLFFLFLFPARQTRGRISHILIIRLFGKPICWIYAWASSSHDNMLIAALLLSRPDYFSIFQSPCLSSMRALGRPEPWALYRFLTFWRGLHSSPWMGCSMTLLG